VSTRDDYDYFRRRVAYLRNEAEVATDAETRAIFSSGADATQEHVDRLLKDLSHD
jgi:hypothetical protein